MFRTIGIYSYHSLKKVKCLDEEGRFDVDGRYARSESGRCVLIQNKVINLFKNKEYTADGSKMPRRKTV
jgi:hypothetical protein